ncbi:hypothetical protein GCM10011383_08570 [Hymenobacter cavernae]|uniref:Uncharacterized protein n=1 Tax=Hymenobacter cavernae TaxID=2044852 RepID=A0ABQ1TNL8_9BACT|nr:hypothetical protein GCM10011383_08570 [Hymenobacter cavernae]
MVGIRDAQVENPKPDTKKKTAVARRARAGERERTEVAGMEAFKPEIGSKMHCSNSKGKAAIRFLPLKGLA